MHRYESAKLLMGLILSMGLVIASSGTSAWAGVAPNGVTNNTPGKFKLYHQPSQTRGLKQGFGNPGMNNKTNGNHRHLYSLYGKKSNKNQLSGPGSIMSKPRGHASGGYR